MKAMDISINENNISLSVFPNDILFSEKEKLIKTKKTNSILDLQDDFIQTFVPQVFHHDSTSNWTKEKVFDNNEILINGKIFGIIVKFVVSNSNANQINLLENDNAENIYFLSEDKYVNIWKLLYAGSNDGGDIFIPLIPIIAHEEDKDLPNVFIYPDYAHTICSDLNISLPTSFDTLMVLDVYNFIISYFLRREFLSIISIYNPHRKTFHKAHNNVKYNLDAKYISYEWIQCVVGKNGVGAICPVPIIIWVLYFHIIRYGFMPIYFQKIFNKRIQCDKYGTISMNNLHFK